MRSQLFRSLLAENSESLLGFPTISNRLQCFFTDALETHSTIREYVRAQDRAEGDRHEVGGAGSVGVIHAVERVQRAQQRDEERAQADRAKGGGECALEARPERALLRTRTVQICMTK